MQTKGRISLNAIRLFVEVARTRSLKLAGAEIGVTPSAISHRIRKLEETLGVLLFARSNNAITLTNAGNRLYEQVAPAVASIEKSVDALHREEDEVGVHVSTSLAMRWLIPALDRFRAAYPRTRVRIETGPMVEMQVSPSADVAIRYFRADEDAGGWEMFAPDLCRPVVAPRLLPEGATGFEDIAALPAIQCASGNWDWRLWCTKSGIAFEAMSFRHAFDTDDAALHACAAGMGVMLAPPLLTHREIAAGRLVELAAFAPVQLGSYRILCRSDALAVRQFRRWLDLSISAGV